MQRLLIVGFGDVARRAVPLLRARFRVFALVRSDAAAAVARAAGAIPVRGDLDHRASLRRLTGLAHVVLHFAPPPAEGHGDARTVRLASALARGRTLPHRLVYISTSGVYGDCAGARIDETRPVRPESDRARRRVAAERVVRALGARRGVHVAVLRVPGIYAADRLPTERIARGAPVVEATEDSYTNHIHADDLAAMLPVVLRRARPNRVYHATDDSELRMGDWFDLVADHFGLARPPRLPRARALEVLPAASASFMRESRRLDNRRLRLELRYRLRYPTVSDALAVMSGRDRARV